MKITLILNGKTEESFFRDAMQHYLDRLRHYIRVEVIEIPFSRNTASTTPAMIAEKEAEALTKFIGTADHVVLLDERGTKMTSPQLAAFLQNKMNAGMKHLVFVTGGPYGFSPRVYKLAKDMISLSSMTFPHQMVRVIFAEQLYRAFTIIKNESYHH